MEKTKDADYKAGFSRGWDTGERSPGGGGGGPCPQGPLHPDCPTVLSPGLTTRAGVSRSAPRYAATWVPDSQASSQQAASPPRKQQARPCADLGVLPVSDALQSWHSPTRPHPPE